MTWHDLPVDVEYTISGFIQESSENVQNNWEGKNRKIPEFTTDRLRTFFFNDNLPSNIRGAEIWIKISIQ